MKIGVLSPSEIAFRRFLPALKKVKSIEFGGVAIANKNEWKNSSTYDYDREKARADKFTTSYGGKLFSSYTEIIENNELDAVYIPLPPALHHYWAKKALLANKHVLVEKPATTNLSDTQELISIAKTKKLALHENYMFVFHNQLKEILHLISSDAVGEVRLFRLAFGFPKRPVSDFRYIKSLGGGALLDCGGYPIKLASLLLGDDAIIGQASSNYINGIEVDMYGSATLSNKNRVTAQIAFGMDNSYKCEMEVWGSKGTLTTNRIFTAPDNFNPEVFIQEGNSTKRVLLAADDSFMKSIEHFYHCFKSDSVRNNNYSTIEKQATLISNFQLLTKNTQ